MTNADNSTRRSRRGIRRAVGAAIAAGLLFGGVAAAGIPAFAANAAPVAEATVAEEISPYVMPAPASERGVPGVGLSIFFGTALTLGAGGIVTARLLAHRHHVEQARARA